MAETLQFGRLRRMDSPGEPLPLLRLDAQRDAIPQVGLVCRSHGPLMPGGFLPFGRVSHQFLVAQIVRVSLEIGPRRSQRVLLAPELAEYFRSEPLQPVAAFILPVSTALELYSSFQPFERLGPMLVGHLY